MSTSPTTKPQSSATQAIFRWTFTGAPIRIDLPIDLISRLCAELGQRESYGCSEGGGVLLGQRITRRAVKINDYLWISPEKPGTRYHLDPSALERLREERSARAEDAMRSRVSRTILFIRVASVTSIPTIRTLSCPLRARPSGH